MQQRRITAEILQLTRWGLFNCYLVREQDGWTLVDTTFKSSAPRILAIIQSTGMRLRRILLTHAHGDHIGALDALARDTGAEVAIGRREARLLAGNTSLDPDEPHTNIHPRLFPGAQTRPSVLLNHGDTFGSLRAVATPGHTPGHFSYFDPRSNTLIAGDALFSVGGLRVVTDAPWYFPLPKFATWNGPLAITSAGTLAGLSPQQIVCGHGRPITDGTTSLAVALARAVRKMR